MTNAFVHLETNDNSLNKKIEESVESYSNEKKLPERDSNIVKLYEKKAAKSYDVDRSKNDIENAVELLSIAYNATPLKAGEVRVKISGIHQKVIISQSNAERMMDKAAREANRISEDLEDVFSVLKDSTEEEQKDFITNEFSGIVKDIESKASQISEGLMGVAQSFDEISEETLAATSTSELILSEEVKEREKAEKEIADYKAKQAYLENLLKSLRQSIDKYNKLAKSMEAKADTADNRAFITGLIQIGAQALSSIASVACMSMGGPVGIATRTATRTLSDVGDMVKPVKPDEGKNPAELETKKAEIKQKKTKAKKEVAELEKDISDIEGQVKETQAKIDKKPEGSVTEKAELEQLQDNLKEKKTELEKKQQSLKDLQGQLDKLSQSAGQVRKQELEVAKSFRQLQAEFLDKAEAYEKEKMTQDAELVKIKSLLTSQNKTHENVELTIKTLILSIKSLKRVKSILEEVAAFFKNFAAFLEGVSEDAKKQSELVEKAAAGSSFNMKRVLKGIDQFTISQCAEWYATESLASRFVDAFHSGWKMMNEMSGNYLDEEELKAYIGTAAKRIEEIAKSREQAANAKIVDINQFREQLEQEATEEEAVV